MYHITVRIWKSWESSHLSFEKKLATDLKRNDTVSGRLIGMWFRIYKEQSWNVVIIRWMLNTHHYICNFTDKSIT